ncbi:MAG: radical SAM protein, partial [Armatimonadetes bacterium]|nr:radical SAM protein [Armatimonadota bacterium]
MAVRRRVLAAERPTSSSHSGPGPVRAAVVYPGGYSEGMATLSVHRLLELFNCAPCKVERVFSFPRLSDLTRSIETASPLGDFDLLLVTVPFELQYFDLAAMLEAGGVPAAADERAEGDPVVLAGGPAPSGNPAPIAAMADLVFVGEIEAQADAIRQALRDAVADGGSRQAFLDALRSVPGMLDCAAWRAGKLEARVQRQWELGADSVAHTVIVAPEAELSGRGLIEVARGCPHACKFCLARQLYYPFRPGSVEAVGAAMEELAGVASAVGLVAPSFADHPQALQLVERAVALGLEVSVSSLRTDRLPRDARLLELLAQAGQRTITLAPEAGTESLRQGIAKPLAEERLEEAVRVIAGTGFARLKLYFMLGLPGETDDDVEAIAHLLARLRRLAPKLELAASVACFVPKGHTPFAGEVLPEEAVLRRRLRKLQALAGREGVDVDLPSLRSARLQALLSRGGLEIAGAVVAAGRGRRPGGAFERQLEEAGLGVREYWRRGSPEPGWTVVDLTHRRATDPGSVPQDG